ncbi:MAG: hypothetical protein ACRCY4_07755 [Brevinema sp.]
MRVLFLWLMIMLASCSRQAKPTEAVAPSLYLLSSSPVASLVYSSSLQDGRPYYENFSFKDEVGGTTITVTLNGETNKVRIDHNFDLVRAEYTKQGHTLMVERSGNSLVYYVNGENTTRYQIPRGRVVVFPEIQLRDFFYSGETNLAYTQLFTGDFRASAMLATKKPVSNIQTMNGYKEVIPVEITTYNIQPSQWAMIFYFDSLGWVVKKDGFISLEAGKEPSERALRRNPYAYLGKRSYSSELVIRHSMGFQP